MTSQTAPGRRTQKETHATRAGRTHAGKHRCAGLGRPPQRRRAPRRQWWGRSPGRGRDPGSGGGGGVGGELRRDWPTPAGLGRGWRREAGTWSEGGVSRGWGRSFSINKAPDWSGGFFSFFPRALAPSTLVALVGARQTAGEPRTRGRAAGGLFAGQASSGGTGAWQRECAAVLPSALSQTAGPGAALIASLDLRRPGCRVRLEEAGESRRPNAVWHKAPGKS